MGGGGGGRGGGTLVRIQPTTQLQIYFVNVCINQNIISIVL